MNLEHFLSKMPLKPPWLPQLPEASPESSQIASESLPDASQSVAILAQGITDQGDIQGGIRKLSAVWVLAGPGWGFCVPQQFFVALHSHHLFDCCADDGSSTNYPAAESMGD